MPANAHKPRRRNEVELLPTRDGRELLSSMIATVGLKETARRLARCPTTVRRWHRGRDPVPEVVRQWLLSAATNSRKTGSLDGLKWHYPRARPIVRERHRAAVLALREAWAAEKRRDWELFLAQGVDPYA